MALLVRVARICRACACALVPDGSRVAVRARGGRGASLALLPLEVRHGRAHVRVRTQSKTSSR
eukprot:6979004-Prymnesium_polylepis.1